MTRLSETQMELVKAISQECNTPAEVTSLLKSLFAGTLEQMLQAEMDEHLGYETHSAVGDNSGNSRNGYGKKTIKSEWGESEIAVPRDRNGTFEPSVIEKRQTRTDEIEARVLAMYSKGLSTRDIEDHLRDIYGVEASATLISRITDRIMPELNEWQSRPLSEVYPVVFFDGIDFKVKKDGKVINKCAYSVLGIDMDGKKDILGIWISENESASFWTVVFNELKNRGVKDILMACHDNLSGFVNAINTAFPKTDSQLCIIHQIRNSTKYVSYKDLKPLMADLENIYGAVSEDAALYALEEFSECLLRKHALRAPDIFRVLGEKWNNKYPQIHKSLGT